jgi:3-oxoacyl-[acyl-carrier-protein] synthase III
LGDRRYGVKIAGLGKYLPTDTVTSAELERRWGVMRGRLLRVTGVDQRRYERKKTTAEMAAEASIAALNDAGLTIAEIDTIVGASAIPQQVLPCMASLLQRELGGESSFCFDVNATCLSFVAALHTSAILLCSGEAKRVLICSSEKTSLALNPKEFESAGLFGDAAAAVVVVRTPPGEPSAIECTRFETHSRGAHLATVLGGGTLHHPNDPATKFEDNLFHMDGPGILRFATERYDEFLQAFLASAGRTTDDFDFVVPHQASRSALHLLVARYGFRKEQVLNSIECRGNCIAASIPLTLAEAVESNRIRRGQRLLLTGTAAGLSLGALEMVF